MKKTILSILVLGAFLYGGQGVWADDIYVVGGVRTVGIKITSLPCTIINPGFYYLGRNLAYSGDGNAITIEADNVTLDLMGFNLTNTNTPGYAAYGVSITGHKDVEVRNGGIINFQEGLQETSAGGANHRAINLRLSRNGDAIYLRGNNHLVKNCNASNNSFGILINGGTITDCVACDNTNTGIRLTGAGSVLGNVANNNTTRNFRLGTANTETFITVNRNSASGLATNYYKESNSTGVVISTLNAGQP